MIPFIEKKEIDWHQVEKILRNSKRLNQYANGGPAVKKLENLIIKEKLQVFWEECQLLYKHELGRV